MKKFSLIFMIALLTSIILIIPIDAIAIHTSTSSNSSRTITYHHFGIEKNIDIHISFNAYDMVYSPSGKYLAICDHHITVVDTSNWETKAYYYLGDWTSDLEYSPDGEMIAISSHYDIYIFDANTLDLIKELDGVHTSPIGSLDFSPNGNYLASGANDGLCKIWNTNNWELYKNISLEKEKGLSWVEGVCYSPNGYYLVTSTDYSYYNDEIKIWNTNTWEEIKTITGYNDFFSIHQFSLDGKKYLSSSGSNIYIWQTSNWNLIRTVITNGNKVREGIYSPNGDYFVAGVDKNITIWDTSSWIEVQSIEAHDDDLKCLAYSPISYCLVSADWGDSIKVWSEDSDLDSFADKIDKFPSDPAAFKDSDSDGAPNEWNPGKTELDSTTGLYLDAFIHEPAASIDTDGDGAPDEWNPGKSEKDALTVIWLDRFPDDPAASKDTDGDGFPDEWNYGKSQNDSMTELRFDSFPKDPAASLDTDGDGYPDQWNTGMSKENSTTGLSLDAFPDDPLKWADSDNDYVPDNEDAFPNDAAASVDTDSDNYPDYWNPDRSEGDSTTGLVLDKFPNDPAAGIDSDGDEYPDIWNPGKSQDDSTSNPRLQLDMFPDEPSEYLDSDGDRMGDQSDNDDDNDGYLDAWELFQGTDPKNPSATPLDSDGDGEPNGDIGNSQPWMDTDDDNDNFSDSKELKEDTDPLDPDSKPKRNEGNGETPQNWLLIYIFIIVGVIIIGMFSFLMIRKKNQNYSGSHPSYHTTTNTQPIHGRIGQPPTSYNHYDSYDQQQPRYQQQEYQYQYYQPNNYEPHLPYTHTRERYQHDQSRMQPVQNHYQNPNEVDQYNNWPVQNNRRFNDNRRY